MDDLKPCPFCGWKGELHYLRVLDAFIVECTNDECPASYMIGNRFKNANEAKEAWNTREG